MIEATPAPVVAPDSSKVLGRPARVLVTKIGLDGHDRGSRLVAGFLRDAGMEVIYTAPWQAIETVVRQAMEEDVDVIGISSLATDHLLVPQLMKALRETQMDDVAVVVGGIIPENEIGLLEDAGVAAVFHPGASRDHIVGRITSLIIERRGEA